MYMSTSSDINGEESAWMDKLGRLFFSGELQSPSRSVMTRIRTRSEASDAPQSVIDLLVSVTWCSCPWRKYQSA
ncbi:unnamed protein product [Toxocara canis]|uniref:PH domain-containing protein n=1 Tax=Toxocara canis TaxID=6265 RepID=A0A183UER8_TOXCA|nr:unnamed protein product [Toxocara canis]